ncbi:hypothetical protein IW261DRAFT_330968 [Armillaria novae-zelandiae]|uniref:Secreted protein n=1 Tax=Armillaria novae-zelandiae TaxID=153914 RepID=A0AA39P3B5_9AGAR|nr:hypothetical protein IW261DRAFT_330968 [Armillaria novae-zelandiae]
MVMAKAWSWFLLFSLFDLLILLLQISAERSWVRKKNYIKYTRDGGEPRRLVSILRLVSICQWVSDDSGRHVEARSLSFCVASNKLMGTTARSYR